MTSSTVTSFVPPSPGSWELEQTHLTRPISYFMAEVFPGEMMRGFKDASRAYGVLLDHLEVAIINGFAGESKKKKSSCRILKRRNCTMVRSVY